MNSLSRWRGPLLGLWPQRTASCRLPLCQGVPACTTLFLLWLCSPKRFLSDLKAVIWLGWNLSYFWRKLQDHDMTWWIQVLGNWQRSRAGVRPEMLLHLLLLLSCIAEVEILKLDTALSMPPPSSSRGTTLWSIGGRLGGRRIRMLNQRSDFRHILSCLTGLPWFYWPLQVLPAFAKRIIQGQKLLGSPLYFNQWPLGTIYL